MAELYLAQGHAHEALTIYRELYLRHPDDGRLRDKVTALETAQAAADPGEPELTDYAAAAAAQTFPAMFRQLLAARPAAAPGWSPVSAPVATSTSAAESAAPRVSEGQTARHDNDPVSSRA